MDEISSCLQVLGGEAWVLQNPTDTQGWADQSTTHSGPVSGPYCPVSCEYLCPSSLRQANIHKTAPNTDTWPVKTTLSSAGISETSCTVRVQCRWERTSLAGPLGWAAVTPVLMRVSGAGTHPKERLVLLRSKPTAPAFPHWQLRRLFDNLTRHSSPTPNNPPEYLLRQLQWSSR